MAKQGRVEGQSIADARKAELLAKMGKGPKQTFPQTDKQANVPETTKPPTQVTPIAKPSTQAASSPKAQTDTQTFPQTSQEVDVFANVKKAVGQTKERFEDTRRRQTYWQTEEDIEAVEALHKATGLPKYQIVSEAIQAMRLAVLGDK